EGHDGSAGRTRRMGCTGLCAAVRRTGAQPVASTESPAAFCRNCRLCMACLACDAGPVATVSLALCAGRGAPGGDAGHLTQHWAKCIGMASDDLHLPQEP